MRRRLIVVAVAMAAIIGLAALLTSGGSKPIAAPVATTTTVKAAAVTTTSLPPGAAEAADPVGDHVDLYAAPNDPAPSDTLTNPTFENVPLALLVKERGPDGWLRVQYPKRPNGATAWIKADQVVLRSVANRIEISVAGHVLTVFKGTTNEVLMQARVATGAARTPTPLGSFYIDVIVDLIRKTGPYGAYELSVAGFSDALQSFGGGVGQIAIHGTNQPELIGLDVSNGCIRMSNEDVTTLFSLVTTGTPVQIEA